MAPRRVVGSQLRVGQVAGLDGVVLRRKVEVGAARYEDGPGGDAAKRPLEIASIGRVGTDVGGLPGPQLGEQVVRVPVQVILLPILKQGFHGIEPQVPVL